MYKMSFKYTDFFGNDREEDVRFHLFKNEIAQIDVGEIGGLEKSVERMNQKQNKKAIFDLFEKIILTAYGEISDDGRAFIKVKDGKALSEEFKQTKMYEILFDKLCNEDGFAKEFIMNIIPEEVREQVFNKEEATTNVPTIVENNA